MPRRVRTAARIEALETRCLLNSSYVVYGVSDFAPSQPFMNYYFTGTPGGAPVQIDDGTGDGGTTFEDFSIPAYLDTGTSGMILDQTTVQDFGVQNETYQGSPVVFNDIGIGGGQTFTVSEPLYMGLAPNDPNVDVNDPATWQSVYTQTYGTASAPIHLENNPNTTYDPNTQLLPEPTNILGMPFMMGKVVVMNPTPVFSTDFNTYGDMNTYIYNPGTAFTGATGDPGIPPTSLHVQLSYADFLPYTTQYPPDAPGPTFAPNPIIGPNPIHQINPNVPAGNAPPLSVTYGTSSTTGSFLFDTGAQISFVSQALAAQLGVHYKAGTYGTDDPILVDNNGIPVPNQQPVPIGGTGSGTVTDSEFWLDSLTLQTVEGTPITFTQVPVLVQDVSIQDPNTGQILTLDGDFGANMLFGTDSTGQNAAFNWVTFDQPNGQIGFAPAGQAGSAAIIGRDIFYNDSGFDGNNPAANAADDNAIATDKHALWLYSGLATQANYTSYSKGINGIMIDVVNFPTGKTLGASDFNFVEGNSLAPTQWTAAPAPTSILVRPGAGVDGSTRIELTWADGAIKNQWLQVTMLGNADTGMPIDDEFYFGNLIGSSAQPAANGNFTVTSADLTAARNDPHTFLNPASVTDLQDYNRDGRVDALDQLIARAQTGVSIVDFNSPAPFGGFGASASGSALQPARVLTSAFHPAATTTVRPPTPDAIRHTSARRRKTAPLLHTTISWENERHILLMSWQTHFRKWSNVIIRPTARR
ncbi:MAG TPA: hypothetical protein VN541_16000 [Tepidisphaeraceae bacterium]|nr:hypothetical protein [Tepidisphaeraceae bacterium]